MLKANKVSDDYLEKNIKITKKEPVTILFTNQYEKFIGNELNRKLNKSHAKSLLQSLKDNGYYEYTPILCDQNFVLLDGHHKIAALTLYHQETGKRLEFAFRVKFCETDADRLREMQIHNAYKKDWSLRQTLKISNTSYAKFYQSLEEKWKNVKIHMPKKRVQMNFTDYMDPSSVNKAIGIHLSKPDLASKKEISDQDMLDIIKLYEIVYNNLLLFKKVPPLKRAFVNNCGKAIGLLEGRKFDFQLWRNYVNENFTEEEINSSQFIIDLDKIFREYLRKI